MSLFEPNRPNEIENWECVFETTLEFEVEMAKNYLSNLRIPSNILSKRDTAYSLVVGDMAQMYLYVPREFAGKARAALEGLQDHDGDFSGEESE
jgi:hypothetical protein